jgi:hypothetical protein
MGKHQWLPNDHLLVTESLQGRAFELDEKKRIVWEYRNLVSDQVAGLVETVQRLPSDYRSVFPAH